MEKKEFNPNQLNDLESKLSDLLPEPIEFLALTTKNGNYFGVVQWDASEKNKSGRGTIIFQCKKESNKVTDLKISDLTGGLSGVNQSIFNLTL